MNHCTCKSSVNRFHKILHFLMFLVKGTALTPPLLQHQIKIRISNYKYKYNANLCLCLSLSLYTYPKFHVLSMKDVRSNIINEFSSMSMLTSSIDQFEIVKNRVTATLDQSMFHINALLLSAKFTTLQQNVPAVSKCLPLHRGKLIILLFYIFVSNKNQVILH